MLNQLLTFVSSLQDNERCKTSNDANSVGHGKNFVVSTVLQYCLKVDGLLSYLFQVGSAEKTEDPNYDAHVAKFDVMIADMNECKGYTVLWQL